MDKEKLKGLYLAKGELVTQIEILQQNLQSVNVELGKVLSVPQEQPKLEAVADEVKPE